MAKKVRRIKIKAAKAQQAITVVVPNVGARTKKKKKRGPASDRYRGPPAAMSAAVEEVCGLTNAICPEAFGAKYPDTNQAKTFSYPIRGLLNVNTYSTTGESCFVIVPGYTYGYSGMTSMTGGVGTMPNLSALAGTSTVTPSEWRLVSFTAKIQSITAPLSASGGFVVAEIAGADTMNLTTIDLNALTQFSEYKLYPLAHYEPVFYHFRRGGVKSNEFEPLNSATISAVDTNDWPVLVIGVLGGPATSTNVVRVEYTAHFEQKYPVGSAFAVMTTPPLGEHPKTLQALSLMARVNSPIVAASTENDANAVVARQAAKAVASAVGGYMGGAGGADIAGGLANLFLERYST
jgi:hypothetical protein